MGQNDHFWNTFLFIQVWSALTLNSTLRMLDFQIIAYYFKFKRSGKIFGRILHLRKILKYLTIFWRLIYLLEKIDHNLVKFMEFWKFTLLWMPKKWI